MNLATLIGRGGEDDAATKIAKARRAVADAQLLYSLTQHEGWAVFVRAVHEQMRMDKDALIERMQAKSLWRFLRDGDWKLAARIAGMKRVLEMVDTLIRSGAIAEGWLADNAPR